LDDTACHATTSHSPVRSFEPLRGRTVEAEEERVPNQMEKVPLVRVGQQGRTEAHSSTVLIGLPPSYTDLGLILQIVKEMMEGMAGSTTQVILATQVL
jgi:hypothetical protein